ncbi:AEL236Cp [Eremothecium gossypii ATCC 10895]|uniref:AEL236Cp n=1 Tax=Eremothecium gossypii (strain ATCC 10895 / CBS 109.51 / FGSC 9923 / NRRL Y-1056) TaxID=284811 RepID=Q758J8_EREGS|nr:AEL236Cp [Eremothecium gossypii ATCC 10895]AAS52449.2 AEL236Cp [Eremothecium gossypii ATCC 10895]AEY96748.1 FAEL236Cp [Eremothecium gossypii FDAG1]
MELRRSNRLRKTNKEAVAEEQSSSEEEGDGFRRSGERMKRRVRPRRADATAGSGLRRDVEEALGVLPRPRYYFADGARARGAVRWGVESGAVDRTAGMLDGWLSKHGENAVGPETAAAVARIARQLRQLGREVAAAPAEEDTASLLERVVADGTRQDEVCQQLTGLIDGLAEAADEEWIAALARIHELDLQDIADMPAPRPPKRGAAAQAGPCSRRADLQFVINKWNKLLTRERNLALYWPSKAPRKDSGHMSPAAQALSQEDPRDKFRDVPLFS